MITKLRWFIPSFLVLALLGLLATVPAMAAPAGADGTIALSGGYSTGSFFSAKGGFNVATATVTDTDLSSQRTGTVRLTNAANVAAFTLPAATSILEGEIAKTESFTATANQTEFTLAQMPRDADADGIYQLVTTADVQVKKNGIALANGTYTVHTVNKTVTLGTGAAVNDVIAITYEYSEYDTATPANTPIGSAASHGVSYGATFAGLITEATPISAVTTTGVITLPAVVVNTNEVKIVFKYEVQDIKTKLITFSTATSVAKGVERKLTGTESTTISNKLVNEVAIVTASDYDTIRSAAETAGVTSVDHIQAITGATVDALLTALSTALGYTEGTAGSGDLLFAQMLPAADGDILTAAYVDGTTTRSDTATVDMKAPVVSNISPASGTYINSLTQTLSADVTDETSGDGVTPSGMAVANADTLSLDTPGAAANANQAIVPMLIASNSYRVSRAVTLTANDEGTTKWWITAKDNVGNITTFTDSRTAAQTKQGNANPAVLGAGDVGNPATTANVGNPVLLKLDTNAPTPEVTTPAVTGGKLDTVLTSIPTGSVTTADTNGLSLDDTQATFVTDKVAAGHLVTNLTDGSTCTVVTIESNIALTCAAALAGGAVNDFLINENYKITNPALGNAIASNTAKSKLRVDFALGTGGAPLDATTVDATDFTVDGYTVTGAEVDKAGDKVLLTVTPDLATDAKPKTSLTGSVADLSGNTMAVFSGTTAPAALTPADGLAPEITDVVMTGTSTSGQAASNGSMVITFSSGENAATTPTVVSRYMAHNAVASPAQSLTMTGATHNGVVTATATKSWTTTTKITSATGASLAGLVNVVITVTDAAGNAATSGKTDPDGTTAGTILAAAHVFEFDNRLNEGQSLQANVYALSPSTGLDATTGAVKTDVGTPFITVNFDNTAGNGGEDKEYSLTAASTTIETDTHKAVTLNTATWTDPDGVATDVLASMTAIDVNSFVYAPTGIANGAHTLTVTATDDVGNISTNVGSATATVFTLKVLKTDRAAFSLAIQPGTNLVSLPAEPIDGAINTVIGVDNGITLVMTYDNGTGLWQVASRTTDADTLEGNLSAIDAQHGYWIQSDRSVTLKPVLPRAGAGSSAFPTLLHHYKGWNLMPVNDPLQQAAGTNIVANVYLGVPIGGQTPWIAAVTYSPANAAYSKVVPGGNVQVGSAYFVYFRVDGVLIP